jgi:RHS repeat-associated protein
VPGAGLDEPLVSITAGTGARAWYHADAQGSVLGRSAAAGGTPVAGQRFSYTPYGETGAGSGAPVAFRWLGRRLEPVAPAAGLYDMRARVYAAGLGRFLQPDPIGTEGWLNLYAYVENDPLNMADPTGNHPLLILALGAAFGVGVDYSFNASSYRGATTTDAVTRGAIAAGVGALGAIAGPAIVYGATRPAVAAAATRVVGSRPVVGGAAIEIVAGAIGGAAGNALQQVAQEQVGLRTNISWTEVGVAASLGALAGYAPGAIRSAGQTPAPATTVGRLYETASQARGGILGGAAEGIARRLK